MTDRWAEAWAIRLWVAMRNGSVVTAFWILSLIPIRDEKLTYRVFEQC